MAKAEFTEDFNFTPKELGGRVSKRYRAGVIYKDCTRECIEQAKAKGVLKNEVKGSKANNSAPEPDTNESQGSGAAED